MLAGEDDLGPVTKLYRNDGFAGFTEIQTSLTPVATSAFAWGDYDNDGDLDLLLTGTDNSESAVAKIFRNDGNSVFTEVEAELSGIIDGSIAWGDYDNDGDLDILLNGPQNFFFSTTQLVRNNTCQENTIPGAPLLLGAAFNNDSVELSWGSGIDVETPVFGVTYNLRVGTVPGANDIVAPMSETGLTGQRRIVARGNAGSRLSHTIKGLISGQTYFWSVQTIDTAFAGSPFALEQSFTVPGPCEIICLGNITVNADAGKCSAAVDFPDVQTSGRCGELLFDPPAGYFFPVGETTVTAMTGDAQTSCSFTVTVNDVEPPSISCPANMVVDAPAEECGATVEFNVPASDNCSTVSVESFPVSGSRFRVGETVVESTATDAAGNETTCSFTITVRDVTPPAIQCPSDIVIDAAANECGAAVDYQVFASDACVQVPRLVGGSGTGAPFGVTTEFSNPPGSTFSVGVTDVTTTVTDAAGNFSVCTFKVTVRDTTPPTITCPSDISVVADKNASSKEVSFDLFASDSCGT